MFDLDAYLGWKVDFANPPGAPAFASPDSVSWRVFKNPIALGVGGVAAVLLEFAEPRIRTGVWEHSNYKTDPAGRAQRTAMAAMIGVYGPQAAARRVIAGVANMHAPVAGQTPAGEAYTANDAELLDWVSATANYGFLTAYHRFVAALDATAQRRFYAEGESVARLYGVRTPIFSGADFDAMLRRLMPRFEPHPIVGEFLELFAFGPGPRGVPKAVRKAMAQGAVSILPDAVRERLALDPKWTLPPLARAMLRAAGALAECVPLADAPPAQACRRLGLPADFLYRSRAAQARLLARWRENAPAIAAE